MSAPTNFRIQHAFQFGLLGGIGVLTAIALGNAAISLAGIITSIITALFITPVSYTHLTLPTSDLV